MELFTILLDNLSFLWETGLPFLVALTILVFVHELGHYMVARWCNVRVEVFSVGFGKELKGWTDKNGTRWKISAIPLGGYVKMFGESELFTENTEGENNQKSMTNCSKIYAPRKSNKSMPKWVQKSLTINPKSDLETTNGH